MNYPVARLSASLSRAATGNYTRITNKMKFGYYMITAVPVEKEMK
jgi:hypothetical protein